MDKYDGIRKVLDEIEQQAKINGVQPNKDENETIKPKLLENLNNLFKLLTEPKNPPLSLKEINDRLECEDYLFILFKESLGQSWKEDIIKMIVHQRDQKENIKFQDKIEEEISVIFAVISNLGSVRPWNNLKNLRRLKTQFEKLFLSLNNTP